MRKSIAILCGVWLVLAGASLWWSIQGALKHRDTHALESTRSFFDLILITREWNASHGGVYVPVTDATQPNPWLKTPLRDIRVNDTLTLTKINPAYMTRQISEIMAQQNTVRFHITSLNPIRPDNAATPMEKAALESFETGIREVSAYIPTDQGTGFFYMAPLITDKSCLKCHAEQGYKEGDIRGGISVTLMRVLDSEIGAIVWAHVGLCTMGFAGILLLGMRLKSAYEMVEKQARFDSLTRIPNRLSFSETIFKEYSRSVRNRTPLSVIICDIDNFKLYNDTFGHAGGDDCLVRVARVMNEALKRPGDFCARYGGEEFVIILPGTSEKGAWRVAENIRVAVEQLRLPNPRSLPWKTVTVSLGVATAAEVDSLSQEELIRRADSALYTAKDRGRNTVSGYSA
ncbi:MAG: diguanylate cyclase [Pseudomonadota bacterium]